MRKKREKIVSGETKKKRERDREDILIEKIIIKLLFL